MKSDLSAQTADFLLFAAVGAASALLFLLDVIITEKKNRFAVCFYDIVFCALFLILFITAVLISKGKLEGYMIFGAFLGALLIFLAFDDFFYKKGRF